MLPNPTFLPAGGVIEGFQDLGNNIRLLYADVAEDLLLYLWTRTLTVIVGMCQINLFFLQLYYRTCSAELTVDNHIPVEV